MMWSTSWVKGSCTWIVTVILRSKKGDAMSVLGDYLRELTYGKSPVRCLQEFVSLGLKCYNCRQDDEKENTKFKGISMSETNSNYIHFNCITEINFDCREIMSLSYCCFVRDGIKCAIYNGPVRKRVKLVYTERILLESFDTLQIFFY